TTAATTTRAPASYRSSIETVTEEQLGSSYRTDLACAQPAELRAVNVTHWGYDGAVHDGRLIVHQDEAENIAAIFGDLYAARFPIQQIAPVDEYGGDDQASMRANNTSGYNCRTVAGSTSLSNHALGAAVDINPLHNPYVKGDTVDPPEGEPWADRSDQRPGMIYGGDVVVTAFGARGWVWGGYWSSPDYQHFDK
ncbi:MAG: M15 family metallopeptidase, partial [Acidimicrobiales bacterium]|nr:M15 family metallopeptidase [Acidimicrobiales bacterium]